MGDEWHESDVDGKVIARVTDVVGLVPFRRKIDERWERQRATDTPAGTSIRRSPERERGASAADAVGQTTMRTGDDCVGKNECA